MKRWAVHILFWILILFWSSTIYDYNGKYGWHFVQMMALRLPLIIAATYMISHYILPKYLIAEKRYLAFALSSMAVFIIASLLDRFLLGSAIIGELLGDLSLTYTFFSSIPILRNSFLLLSIISLASGIQFFKLLIKKERREKELQKENLSIKLSLLRSQISPHFTYNALNNLYSIAVQNNDQNTADGLDHLATIMKYLTYDSDVSLVPLSTEVEMINSYIHIQYLRLDDDDETTVTFRNEVNYLQQCIPPVLLLPLIENAFKHGVLVGISSFVSIVLTQHEQMLKLTIKNSLHKSLDSPPPGGKGLLNLQKRLDILFAGEYRLHHGTDGEAYSTYLQIPLGQC